MTTGKSIQSAWNSFFVANGITDQAKKVLGGKVYLPRYETYRGTYEASRQGLFKVMKTI